MKTLLPVVRTKIKRKQFFKANGILSTGTPDSTINKWNEYIKRLCLFEDISQKILSSRSCLKKETIKRTNHPKNFILTIKLFIGQKKRRIRMYFKTGTSFLQWSHHKFILIIAEFKTHSQIKRGHLKLLN